MGYRKYASIGNRYLTTLNFIKENVAENSRILDLGTRNDFTEFLCEHGLKIRNTEGEDLDYHNDLKQKYGEFDVVTGFEILEHLVSPLPLLKDLPADKLIVTVPLKLWFAKTYRNINDPWDQHYHEFEDWQFDWLLEKSGWTILKRVKWTSPSSKLGFRSILRRFTPRYYGVYAERTR